MQVTISRVACPNELAPMLLLCLQTDAISFQLQYVLLTRNRALIELSSQICIKFFEQPVSDLSDYQALSMPSSSVQRADSEAELTQYKAMSVTAAAAVEPLAFGK